MSTGRMIRSIVLLLACAVPPHAVAAQHPLDGLDAYIRRGMAGWQIPGMAVAVIEDDSIVFLRTYGVRQAGRPEPVDTGTIFGFGSLSKSFTAAAVGVLVDEGRVAWDDPVTKHLPWLDLGDPWVTRTVTVRDILAHRVGGAWGRSSLHFILFTGLPWRDALPRMRHLLSQPERFRSGVSYNNANYWTAGALVEAVAGVPWHEFVEDRLFVPLGMTSATTDVHELWDSTATVPCYECVLDGHVVTLADARVKNVAVSHRLDGGRVVTVPVYRIGHDPAGSVHGTILDLTRWLRFQLGGGTFEGRRVLGPEVVAAMHAPQALWAPDPSLGPGGGNLRAYGFGWYMADYHGHLALMHGGGFMAYAGVLPEKRLAVAVLANLPSGLRRALVFRVFDAYLGAPPRDWSAEFLDAARASRERVAAQRERRAAEQPTDDRPALPLSGYVGSYAHPALGDVTVEYDGRRLTFRFIRGHRGELRSWGGNRFRLRWQGPGSDQLVTFEVSGSTAETVTLEFPPATFRRTR